MELTIGIWAFLHPLPDKIMAIKTGIPLCIGYIYETPILSDVLDYQLSIFTLPDEWPSDSSPVAGYFTLEGRKIILSYQHDINHPKP